MNTPNPIRPAYNRRQNYQSVAWFFDLFQRKRLDLDPPYQRRSVWNQAYKDSFVDTILQHYPAPSIFLHEQIDRNGMQVYSVIDGKQRLSTIFEFVEDLFPVSQISEMEEFQGVYFSNLPADLQQRVYSYIFPVEYIPSTDEGLISKIFDRINRNVSKLTPQELRHARFNGQFISAAEELTDWLAHILPDFPKISTTARSQMKDVEFVASLLLLLEEGPRGYSRDELDTAFSVRDDEWENRLELKDLFRNIVSQCKDILEADESGKLRASRLRNQADFYSFFGALVAEEGNLPDANKCAENLVSFIDTLESDLMRLTEPKAGMYYDAARSASNDTGPRRVRVAIMGSVLVGNL